MQIRGFNRAQTLSNGSKKQDYLRSILTERFLSMALKVVSNPDFSKVKTLQNVRRFIKTVPLRYYEKEPDLYALITSIGCVVQQKLDGATEPEELVEYVNVDLNENFSEIKDGIIFPSILKSRDATKNEERLVLKTIKICLTLSNVLENKDKLADIITDLGSGNIANLQETLEELKLVVQELNSEFQKTETSDGGLCIVHTLEPETFDDKFKETYDYVNSPKMVLHTGLKMFNDLISPEGGFRGGTFNIFYADTNTFKSALLRNIAIWIARYNSDMFMEDFLKNGKRPTVLFISLEDGSKEDINRYYSIVTKTDLMQAESFSFACENFRNNYNTIIDITHVNVNNDATMNLQTIDNLIRSLEENNYVVIAVIVDSFDLMSPSDEDIARRVSDETQLLSNRAKAIEKWIGDKPFPLISAHQLNRAGNQYIKEKKDQGVTDIAKVLGRSFISGAYDIERRVHFSAFIYTEFSKFDNEVYLEISREKCRYKRTPVDYFVTKLNDGFFIDDDYGTDFSTCRPSIMPSESFGGEVSEVGGRGASNLLRGNHPISKAEKEELDKKKKDDECKPMFEAKSDGVSEEGVSPEEYVYDMAMWNNYLIFSTYQQQIFQGFTPFYMGEEGSLYKGTDGTEYILKPDYCAVTPFNF